MTTKLIINVGHFTSSQSLQEALASVLGFPGWYGKNWDAFNDCVNHADISAMPSLLVIRGHEILTERLPNDARALREILEEMAISRPDVSVRWETVDEDRID